MRGSRKATTTILIKTHQTLNSVSAVTPYNLHTFTDEKTGAQGGGAMWPRISVSKRRSRDLKQVLNSKDHVLLDLSPQHLSSSLRVLVALPRIMDLP